MVDVATESGVDASPNGLRPLDEHNHRLLSNVHPQGWVNPEPLARYNLVVIGAGAGGLVSAIGAATLGAKVALIEKNLLGGDCLNVGCVPSKALIRAGRAFADVRDAGQFGVKVAGPISVDFPEVMARMRRQRALISPSDGVDRLRAAGVDLYFGEGKFTGPDRIEVGGKTLHFRRAIIATGGQPVVPSILGLAEAGYLTNENVFWLTELPRRLAVIGGGPIGCELSQAFARFGAKVQLLQEGPRIMDREDADAAEVVRQALERDHVVVTCDCKVSNVRTEGVEKVLTIEHGGTHGELRVDALLVGVGRKPNVEGLALGAAGVAYDTTHGVTVDDHLRTSNRKIFAVGDSCFRYHFTHASDATARIAIKNALFLGRVKASSLVIPWCTYTDPEVAHVGMYEKDAKDKGIDLQTIIVPMAEVDRALLDGEEAGFLKVHLKKGTDKILGATLVARHAGEMISEITLAMVSGAGLKAVSRTIHPYPTQAEVIRKAGDAYYMKRFTPWVKKLLDKWMKLRP